MVKKIKLFDPVIGVKEEKVIKRVLQNKFWASGAGVGEVKKFENEMRDYLKTDECVAVNSGTAALHLALSLSNIKNKEVIVPSLSFVSTANAILYNGGKPVFVDIDSKTLNLDLNDLEKKISKKTKAIIPVHFAGNPADIKKITKIAEENNLQVVEDAAHACGAKINKKKIGSHSEFVCFSFHPVKNLAMPSGGLISINSDKSKILKKKLDALRWCGITDRKNSEYNVKNLGWNYYMNEFSAAIGLIQLKKLDKLNKIRRNICQFYFNELKIENKMPIDKNSACHFFWILVKDRESIRKKLFMKGIETGIHYAPIHKMKLYNSKEKLKNTEKISKQIISLPTHPNLSNNDVNYIIKTINKEIKYDK